MAVGWTVAATADANRPTPCIPIPSNQPQLSGPAPLFNLLLTNLITSHQSRFANHLLPSHPHDLVTAIHIDNLPSNSGGTIAGQKDTCRT
jgi:hypothetical protein